MKLQPIITNVHNTFVCLHEWNIKTSTIRIQMTRLLKQLLLLNLHLGSGTLASKCVMRQPITGLWAGGP
jgi:hypothetical protein